MLARHRSAALLCGVRCCRNAGAQAVPRRAPYSVHCERVSQRSSLSASRDRAGAGLAVALFGPATAQLLTPTPGRCASTSRIKPKCFTHCTNSRVFKSFRNAGIKLGISVARFERSTASPSPSTERSRGPTAAPACIGTGRFLRTARRPVDAVERRYPSTRTPSTRRRRLDKGNCHLHVGREAKIEA